MQNQNNTQHHHRRSIRLPGYDYTQPGAYFVTICCHDRREIFGKVVAGEMQLNTIGRLAVREWERLSSRFRSIELGAFVIMPNHIHAILIIGGRGTAAAEKDPDPSITRRAPTAAAEKDLDPSITRRAPTEQFGKPVPGSIPTIIRSYKSAVSLRVNRLRDRPDHPVWQRNYYERVIRSDTEHQRVHDYIVGNPELWEEDPENPLLLVK